MRSNFEGADVSLRDVPAPPPESVWDWRTDQDAPDRFAQGNAEPMACQSSIRLATMRAYTRKEPFMPVIRVAMFLGRTDEQKERLALRITQAFVEEAQGTPESVHVLFEEIARSDWAVAGKLASQRDRRS